MREGGHHFASRPLSEWASLVHFLYCSAWSIIFALCFGRYCFASIEGSSGATQQFLCAVAAVLIISALWSDIRLESYFSRILGEVEKAPEGK